MTLQFIHQNTKPLEDYDLIEDPRDTNPLARFGNWFKGLTDGDDSTQGGFQRGELVRRKAADGKMQVFTVVKDLSTGVEKFEPTTPADFRRNGLPGESQSGIQAGVAKDDRGNQFEETKGAVVGARKRREGYRAKSFEESNRRFDVNAGISQRAQDITRESNLLTHDLNNRITSLDEARGVHGMRLGEASSQRADAAMTQQIANSRFQNAMTLEQDVYNRWRDRTNILTQSLPSSLALLGRGLDRMFR